MNRLSSDKEEKGNSRSLLFFIMGGIITGLTVGGVFPAAGVATSFLGELFLQALTLMVTPLLLASMVVGITRLGDVRKLGRIGGVTITYYLLTTMIAVLIGIVLVNITRPGVHIRGKEVHEEYRYRISGHTIYLLEGDKLNESGFDSRYQVTLLDQNIRALIDDSAPSSHTTITVSHWLRDEWVTPWEAAALLGISEPEVWKRIKSGSLKSRSRDPAMEVLVSVSEDKTGKMVAPQETGLGIKLDLPIAERTADKGKTFLAVLGDMLLGLIPSNIFKAMVHMDILPLIIFSLIFGAVLTTLGRRAKIVIQFFEIVNDTIMKMVELLMWFAPIGIASLIATRLGNAGGWAGFMPELIKLGKYAGTVIAGLVIHAFIVLPLILSLIGRRKVLPYTWNMLNALTTAFSTASSAATLPVTMECVVEKNRVSARTSSFVVPLGATVNMDGTALYEAVAAIFVAQIYGIQLEPFQQFIVFVTATLAAIGAAGIPEAGLVTMVLVLKAVGLPVEGITLILCIDWFLDRCRTTVNVWGDAVGAATIDEIVGNKREGEPPEKSAELHIPAEKHNSQTERGGTSAVTIATPGSDGLTFSSIMA